MNPIDQLKSILCDPTGKCCIVGSDEDRAIVDRALQALAEPAPVQEPSHDVVAGAIFDFAGFLTSHKVMIEVGSCSNASPMVERIKEWSGNRGLSLENPDVFGWQMRTAQPRKAVKLTDDEISTIAIDNPPNVHIYARAIEQAVLKANGIEP